ncbi:MAG TPA: glycosyltransferase [Terriglobales bacterium]|nr:glycosyltransferase [Terriglobales bacterium]
MPHCSELRILLVAYPLLTVSEESAGGAEQVLWNLERELAGFGVKTTVAASAGSSVSGELFSTGEPSSQPDDFDRRNREHQERALELLERRAHEGKPFDLVHDHSGSFWPCAREIRCPVLATLHLPRHFYPQEFFNDVPANVSFICVSQSQVHSFSDLDLMAGVVNNGIDLERFSPGEGTRDGLLWLGRICEEKAPHLALEIAEMAGMSITLAGQVYPFSYHRQYFASEIAPRLKRLPQARFQDSPTSKQKLRLLQSAEAVLLTSQVEETSSLVAMEAAACGTPVIALRRGALPEVVEDGVTGFLVETIAEAAAALRRIGQISLKACRKHARTRFSNRRMTQDYLAAYERLMARKHLAAQGREDELQQAS